MILTTHALTGAVIGKNISNVWLVIILSFLSHFILDRFRHGEYLNQKTFGGAFWKTTIDLVIGLSIIGGVSYFSNFTSNDIRNIFIGSFFSMLPDALTLIYWKSKVKILAPLYQFHTWVHKYALNSPERLWNFRNAANDIIISLIAIVVLAYL
jgi:hypothetical protein